MNGKSLMATGGIFSHLITGLLVAGLAGNGWGGQTETLSETKTPGMESVQEPVKADAAATDSIQKPSTADTGATEPDTAVAGSSKALQPETPELNLTDLGFAEETLAGEGFESSGKRRTTMLGWHQRLGLVTAAAMTATLLAGMDGEVTSLHKALGITTGLLYYTTAGFSLFAPKPKVKQEQGNIVLHKWLAWVHGTAMIAGPVMGLLAAKRLEDPESESSKLSAFAADYHGTVMRVGYFSFMTAMFVMVVEF